MIVENIITLCALLIVCVNSLDSLSPQETILCRQCGTELADSNYLIDKVSPGAWRVNNKSVFNKPKTTVQTLVNPFGIKFDIVTLEKSRCSPIGTQQSADSWFPGYTWRICTCPQCGHHIGWMFEVRPEVHHEQMDSHHNEHKEFHGLILDKLLSENFTNSILVMPRTYAM